MLGAIKGGAQSEGSLFRLLSRRWTPLARVKGERLSLPSAAAPEEGSKRARAWIGAERARSLLPVAPAEQAQSRSTWSPWQWVK